MLRLLNRLAVKPLLVAMLCIAMAALRLPSIGVGMDHADIELSQSETQVQHTAAVSRHSGPEQVGSHAGDGDHRYWGGHSHDMPGPAPGARSVAVALPPHLPAARISLLMPRQVPPADRPPRSA